MTLLDASGHCVIDRGGEVGCKGPLLGVLRQDWGGLVGTIDEVGEPGPCGDCLDHGGLLDREPGPGGDRGGSIDDGAADGRRREERRQRIDRGLVTGCSGHYSVDLDRERNA